MSMTKVSFMTVEELSKYLHKHKGKEIGFTSDTKADVKSGVEPSDWYGVAVVNMFDANTTVFGYYGTGLEAIYSPFFTESIYDMYGEEGTTKAIIDYYKTEFNMDINKHFQMCIDKHDLR